MIVVAGSTGQTFSGLWWDRVDVVSKYYSINNYISFYNAFHDYIHCQQDRVMNKEQLLSPQMTVPSVGLVFSSADAVWWIADWRTVYRKLCKYLAIGYRDYLLVKQKYLHSLNIDLISAFLVTKQNDFFFFWLVLRFLGGWKDSFIQNSLYFCSLKM